MKRFSSLLGGFAGGLTGIFILVAIVYAYTVIKPSGLLEDIAGFSISGKQYYIVQVNAGQTDLELTNTIKVDSLNLASADKYQVAGAQIDFDDMASGVGISDNNGVLIDDADAADNDYCKLTASGIEGRSFAEVLSDLSGQAGAAFSWNSQNLTSVGTIGCGDTITMTGTRPATVSGGSAPAIQKKGSSGSWVISFRALGSSDTNLGDFGFYGSSDTLTYYYIGPAYNDTSVKIYADGNLDINKHNGSTIGLKLGGTLVTITAAEINYLEGLNQNLTSTSDVGFGYIKLKVTDVDGNVEGQIWYDDSENKIKYYNGAEVKTLTID